jgi:hypothetical protein
MENLSSLLLLHWTSIVDLLKELPILAEFHENVKFIVLPDDFVDLGNVFVE